MAIILSSEWVSSNGLTRQTALMWKQQPDYARYKEKSSGEAWLVNPWASPNQSSSFSTKAERSVSLTDQLIPPSTTTLNQCWAGNSGALLWSLYWSSEQEPLSPFACARLIVQLNSRRCCHSRPEGPRSKEIWSCYWSIPQNFTQGFLRNLSFLHHRHWIGLYGAMLWIHRKTS